MTSRGHGSVHVYEEMVQQPRDTVAKLCRFLGRPDHLAEKIAQVTAFDYMKKNSSKDAEIGERYLKEGAAFMRRGNTADWKTAFTVAQSEAQDRIFQERMKGSKLAELVKPYM